MISESESVTNRGVTELLDRLRASVHTSSDTWGRDCAVDIKRASLFHHETLQIGLFEARPVSDAGGYVERQSLNVVVLPLSGVFSKHDAPFGFRH